MKLKLKRQSFNLPEIQIEGLKEISKKTGMNLSETLRRAIFEFLANWKK